MIKFRLRTFWHDTSGAITVDWVALSAAAIVIAVGAYGFMDSGTDELKTETGSYFDNINDNMSE